MCAWNMQLSLQGDIVAVPITENSGSIYHDLQLSRTASSGVSGTCRDLGIGRRGLRARDKRGIMGNHLTQQFFSKAPNVHEDALETRGRGRGSCRDLESLL